MTTIALRVPTTLPGQPVPPNGQCYILFARGPIKVRDLIAEKIRAEMRKARAGGMQTTSLLLLLPPDTAVGTELGLGPLAEQFAVKQAQEQFTEGQYLLLYNERPLVDLDEEVDLDRTTSLLFVHVPALMVS